MFVVHLTFSQGISESPSQKPAESVFLCLCEPSGQAQRAFVGRIHSWELRRSPERLGTWPGYRRIPLADGAKGKEVTPLGVKVPHLANQSIGFPVKHEFQVKGK